MSTKGCPIKGEFRDPFSTGKPYPKYLVMHPDVLLYLEQGCGLYDRQENLLFGFSVVVDDREPEVTTWDQIMDRSNAAIVIKATESLLLRDIDTDALVDALKTRGYREVILKR